jgi:hypothetical protein
MDCQSIIIPLCHLKSFGGLGFPSSSCRVDPAGGSSASASDWQWHSDGVDRAGRVVTKEPAWGAVHRPTRMVS